MASVFGDDVKDRAVEEYLASKKAGERVTVASIVAKHGMSTATFSRHLRAYRERHGLPFRRSKRKEPEERLNAEQRSMVAEHALANPGSTLKELTAWASRQLGRRVGMGTVRYALAAAGISKRRLKKERGTPKDTRPPAPSRYTDRHRRRPERREGRPSYPSDFTDAEWEIVEPLWRAEAPALPLDHDLRDVLDAIRYVGATGCQWRYLPHDFPPYPTVFGWFARWSEDGTQERVNAHLGRRLRRVEGREDSPSILIIDSQTARSREGGEDIGYDAGKKLKGRKRHIAVDVTGFPLFIVVTAASTQDRDGLDLLIPGDVRTLCPLLEALLADGAYAGLAADRTEVRTGVPVQIVRRSDANPAGAWAHKDGPEPTKKEGFQVIPLRWIVERSFAWFNRRRRLAVDHERTAVHSRAFFSVAVGYTLAARLAA